MNDEKIVVNDKAEKFLTELSTCLEKRNSRESTEVVQEIRSHLYESLHRGNHIDDILEPLGSPNVLAKAYTAEQQLNRKGTKFSSLVSVFQLASLSILGTILIPILFSISALFILLALFFIGIAATNLLGLTQIPLMVITSTYTLTGFPQFISAIIVSLLMIGVGLSIWKLIQTYCKSVINKYKVSKNLY